MFDLAVRGGQVVTPGGVFFGDIGIAGGKIAALGQVGPALQDLDAGGRIVMPGGVDPHAHIEQMSGMGLMNADTFETATRSAVLGGTTTVISFAAQAKGQRLRDTVADYAARAARGAVIDHAFHITLTDLAVPEFRTDLAGLIADGHRSVKLFTTYAIGLTDRQIVEAMAQVRAAGGLVCVHAENDGLIGWTKDALLAAGLSRPEHHAVSHPRLAELEAVERICRFAEYLDQPVMIFHLSTAEAVAAVRAARGRGVPVWAETCVHYLLHTADVLDRPGVEGAKWMCSPPQRQVSDQVALWAGIERGDIALVSSDHAPYRFDASGKLLAGEKPRFDQIANGLPGLQTRLPLLFHAMVTRGMGCFGRLGGQAGQDGQARNDGQAGQDGQARQDGLLAFAEVTAAGPARLYGLAAKGSITPGKDADLVLWNPGHQVTYGLDDLADAVGYNPYAGHSVTGWPETVLLRGRVLVRGGALLDGPPSGRWQARGQGEARPLGHPAAEVAYLRDKGAL